MEWFNSFSEMLVSLLPVIIVIVVSSCCIDDYENRQDDAHDFILPREDWTFEEEAEFQAMCEEDTRRRREKRKQMLNRFLHKK